MPLVLHACATSANLGPGFDCMGMALDFGNRYQVRLHEGPEHRYHVDGAPWPSRRNLFLEAAQRLADEVARSLPRLSVEVDLGIPFGRGLGSSASATVAGLAASNRILGEPLDAPGLLRLAAQLEGHPDNVAPVLMGGVTLALQEGERVWVEPLEVREPPGLALAIPAFELATERARAALPAVVPLEDAVYNVARAALLAATLASGRLDRLIRALGDRLHQPYRDSLIPGMAQVREAARAAGAWEVTVSGAGPSLLAWCPADRAPRVAEAMAQAWRAEGQPCQARQTAIARNGLIFEEGAWP